MERYLGWLVGGIGALLLVCALAFMTTTSTVGVTMTTPSRETAGSPWTSSQMISSHGESAKEKIRTVTQLARHRVGGGQVLAIRPQSPIVWNIIIQKHSETFNVTTSIPNYKVVNVQSLSS